MVGTAIAVRNSQRRSGRVDRLASGASAPKRWGVGRGASTRRVGPVLPESSATEAPETDPLLVIQQLWSQLSRDDRLRFGGCFSRMVIKAVQTCRTDVAEDTR